VRLLRGLPHVLVKVHQLLDAHFGPRLEEDASTERIERAHDARGCVARQTALGMRTRCSGFFIGTSQTGLPQVGSVRPDRARLPGRALSASARFRALISSTLAC
jgi:hypothetical protein